MQFARSKLMTWESSLDRTWSTTVINSHRDLNASNFYTHASCPFNPQTAPTNIFHAANLTLESNSNKVNQLKQLV